MQAFSEIACVPPSEVVAWCEIRRQSATMREMLYDALLSVQRELQGLREEEAAAAEKSAKRNAEKKGKR